MKVLSLNCNHCGAPLEVSAKARFLTCGFCDARLAVEQTGNSYSTAVIEELQETTQRLSRDVEELKASSAIEQLDAAWDRKRKQHLVSDKNGRQSLPTKGSSVVGGIVVVVFGLFWMSVTLGMASRGPGSFALFPLFGLVFIGAGIFGAINAFGKAEAYQRDLRKYQAERRRLVSEAQR